MSAASEESIRIAKRAIDGTGAQMSARYRDVLELGPRGCFVVYDDTLVQSGELELAVATLEGIADAIEDAVGKRPKMPTQDVLPPACVWLVVLTPSGVVISTVVRYDLNKSATRGVLS